MTITPIKCIEDETYKSRIASDPEMMARTKKPRPDEPRGSSGRGAIGEEVSAELLRDLLELPKKAKCIGGLRPPPRYKVIPIRRMKPVAL